jgi:glutamate-1-semialdehyde 2,1-aminomutase
LAGGVSSALRRAARPYPLYFTGGKGSKLIDVDGNTYIDYGLGWGPNFLGNAPETVGTGITEQVSLGLTYGAQHDLEYEVAERLTELIPCADSVCFANSGTEIVQVALRLARAATGRSLYLKFEGHYHGWDDTVLVSYHPTMQEIAEYKGQPVPVGMGQLEPTSALVVEWNDKEGVEAAFEAHSGAISAIICEPLLCNSGCIPPEAGFLEYLREVTERNGALLIFDEVITGFRLGLQGAQGFYGVIPDLATYGKAIGGGAPLSILAGRKEFMDLISDGRVVHAGTLNGNPLALAAAKASLEVLSAREGEVYKSIRRRGSLLRQGLETTLTSAGHRVITTGEPAAFQLSFMEKQPTTYRDMLGADMAIYSDFAIGLLDAGILVLPDGRWYLSTAHSDEDIEATITVVEELTS